MFSRQFSAFKLSMLQPLSVERFDCTRMVRVNDPAIAHEHIMISPGDDRSNGAISCMRTRSVRARAA